MSGVPVKNSKPAVGITATRSPASQVKSNQASSLYGGDSSKSHIKPQILPGQNTTLGKVGMAADGTGKPVGQMEVKDSTISNPVANTQGAGQNKGEMKVGPQDSTTQLAGKKAKKARSAADILYPGFPLKE